MKNIFGEKFSFYELAGAMIAYDLMKQGYYLVGGAVLFGFVFTNMVAISYIEHSSKL